MFYVSCVRSPCLLGAGDCQPVAGGGLCVDPSSSVYDADSAAGRLQADDPDRLTRLF